MLWDRSEAGRRFVKRILTAVETLRAQERDVVDFPTMPMQPISASNTPHRFSREAPNGYLATVLA